MQGAFCIDRRIGYLALFAVPLVILTVFSLLVNSQKVTQNSRAETPAATPFVAIVSPPPPSSSSCLTLAHRRWNLPGNLIRELPLRVYGLMGGKVSYLALINLNEPQTETSHEGYEAYLGIQGSGMGEPNSADFGKCRDSKMQKL
jgi:hypothetical protein